MICFICQSGKRAARAQAILKEKYGINCEILDGGLNSWKEHGFSLEREKANRGFTIARQERLIVGLLNLAALVLALFVSAWWLVIPFLTGVIMVFTALSGRFPISALLFKMPWNQSKRTPI